MSQSFNITKLAGDRVLVNGHDHAGETHQVILDASEWSTLKQRDHFETATAAYDAAVEEFFAPLTNAAEAASEALKPKKDSAFFVVLQEHEAGSEHKHEELFFLEHDTVVLRLLESSDKSRLIWVGDDIEILEVEELPLLTLGQLVPGLVQDTPEA